MKRDPNMLHRLSFDLQIPHTLDLQQRAEQSIQVQQAVGQAVAPLLTNGEPLGLRVSIDKKKKLDPETQHVEMVIYYKRIEDRELEDAPTFKDLRMLNMCIDCGGAKREGHECPPVEDLEEGIENGE